MSTGEPAQSKAAEPAVVSNTTSPATTAPNNSWKLPDGIEDHLEDGLIKAAVCVTVGGALGMLLFKSGKGWRSAAVASGLGVAVGSTYSRLNDSATNSKIVAVPPPARVQTFQTTRPSTAVTSGTISRNDSSQTKNSTPPPSTTGK